MPEGRARPIRMSGWNWTDSDPWNTSKFLSYNVTPEGESLYAARHVIDHVVIPVVCSFGLVANAISLVVFGRRWTKRNTSNTERAALVGLIALALSDLMFCMFGVPSAFLDPTIPGGGMASSSGRDSNLLVAGFYYATYRPALMNMALYSSTWCIAVVAVERYLAVCHPFHARTLIRISRTVLIHGAVFLSAVIISLPDFLKHIVHRMPCFEPHQAYVCYFRSIRSEFRSRDFLLAYRLLWLSVGTFVPLIIMSYCNIRLLADVFRSKWRGLSDPDRYCTTRLTLTVTGIISMFLVLVCPSVLLSLADTILITYMGQRRSRDIHVIEAAMLATNLLQAIKFSTNFLWYCAVNSHFRRMLADCTPRRRSTSRTSSDSPNKMEMTLVK